MLFSMADRYSWSSRRRRKEPLLLNGPLEVYWENPPGPEPRVMVCRWIGGQEFYRWVEADGFLTPAEAACAMDVSRVYVYRLVREGRLEAVRTDPTRIPLRSIKEFNEERER